MIARFLIAAALLFYVSYWLHSKASLHGWQKYINTRTSQALARGAYYWFVPPGICIMLAVMAGFFIGRGYEELLFPRLRGR